MASAPCRRSNGSRRSATQGKHKLPVRLVKGAYWDTEIKRSQEAGYDGYPVFTRKVSTDISYLACARYMLTRRDVFYPQFATHNAHSVAAVSVMAGNDRNFEFQRLHGMGQALYEQVVGRNRMNQPCRIYAPVGSHEDLLAYLVRRLLENGANTSFVNRLADDEAPIADIIADPVVEIDRHATIPHPRIPLPRDIFAPRVNSRGVPLWEDGMRAHAFAGDRQGAGRRRRTPPRWSAPPSGATGRCARSPIRPTASARSAASMRRAMPRSSRRWRLPTRRRKPGTGAAARRAPGSSSAPPISTRPRRRP